MNHHDLQAQGREMKHKERNIVWSIAMDKCLIEALAIQARNGNKIDKCFNENAYTAACTAVNSHFNFNLSNQKVVNHLKTIKKRHTPIQKDSASFASPSSDDLSDTDGTESYYRQPEYLQEGSQDPPVMKPPIQLPKWSREAGALQEAMLAVASSIQRLAGAIDRSKITINPTELLQAVMEIDGLEEAKQMYAFEYLNADPMKARVFMAYNVRMRKTYLFRQFWWWK
ncbi:Ubiquitin-conjugating enzyme/RWD-like protein [Hibiscus syriacus]|uniref:Ubiquitin-conjugating enzyme/RWD-like protein n=1 Tax=Hibiscus syriacus TaxID=106335 RepID=A0A6A3B356_HIBSY|nr:Ubiquitin-conjugating enzyme/RWD-like protein [Hibiscus syriacus]